MTDHPKLLNLTSFRVLVISCYRISVEVGLEDLWMPDGCKACVDKVM